jgi:hypothetical protein
LPPNTDTDLEFKPVRLGKKIELRYIPFSELAIPWNVCPDATTSRQEHSVIRKSRFGDNKRIDAGSAKSSKILKKADLKGLKNSIAQFGLLKPLEVAELQERLEFFYGKGKYLVIDGQRRYFAIRELLKLPTEDDEKKQRQVLRTDCQNYYIVKGEMQAQKQFESLSIPHYVLIPCLVYPYTTLLQMVRHSIEDKRFSEKPSKDELELAERMGIEGVADLHADDLIELWNLRSRIEDEKKSIEKTLQEIRNRLKKQQKKDGTIQDESKAFDKGER